MFRALATTSTEKRDLLKLQPAELTLLLEHAWNRRRAETVPVGHPDNRSALPGLEVPRLRVIETPRQPGQDRVAPFLAKLDRLTTAGVVAPPSRGLVWPHLIYAYMVENTRIFEVFRRVIHELVHGEKLGTPDEEAVEWIRATEEFLYRHTPPFFIGSLTSEVRTDLRATRRNAYHRMFGMDLNHGTDDSTPYQYVRAENANGEFVGTFEELLREVWIGITNVNNQTGTNPTDNGKIANLAQTLHNMFISRRQGGNLSREEFVAVAMMAWLHLTVDGDAPILRTLRAQAASPEERLFKIASQVGLPAHGLSNSYFRIAEPISELLVLIETDVLSDSEAARALYDPGVTPPVPGTTALPSIMKEIITHWSIVTGRDMKAGRVATS